MELEHLKNRIRQIRGADKKSIYELSLEIGISEHTLNNFLYGQSSKETQEKIREFLEDYETKDEQIAKLKAKIKKYAAINEQETKDYAELKVENVKLKEELDFLKNNTYREALREIREYINDNTDFDKGDYFQSKTAAYDILQIIALYGE